MWDFDDKHMKETKCTEVRNWKVSKQIAIQKISNKQKNNSNNKEGNFLWELKKQI